MRKTARGTTWIGRPCAGTCQALKGTQEQLKTRAEKSKHARGGQEAKTYLVGSKSKRQSVLSNGNTSATMGMMNTHRKTCRLKALLRETERLPLGDLLRCWEVLKTLQQVSRAKWLVVGMENELLMWMAQTVVVTSTRVEPKQRGWLQKVSIHTTMQNGDETAYLCCPNHPQTLKCLAMDSLGQTVNAKESHLNLQISVEHTKSRSGDLLALDMQSQCSRCDGLETE